jgi:zinc transport system ATP-binding protein
MPVTTVEVKKLSVSYGGADVLQDVSFTANPGDYIGIVGPNGSGKTTLIKTMLGLVPASKGQILIEGSPVEKFNGWEKIGYLPQKMPFLDLRFPATAGEIIATGTYAGKRFPKRVTSPDRQAVARVMERLEISDLKHQLIGRLSGGQQQRVLLARAFVREPQLVVLDEPTAALDPQSRESFYAMIKKINRDKKATILFISHDVTALGKQAAKLLYLDRRLIFYGSWESFCQSREMADYFGPFSQHLMCGRH